MRRGLLIQGMKMYSGFGIYFNEKHMEIYFISHILFSECHCHAAKNSGIKDSENISERHCDELRIMLKNTRLEM